ncbi:DNA polymerase alpha subunit 2 [Carabus blaptoides fortunei]
MCDADELANEFKFVGVTVSQEVISKCLEVSAAYNLDAETFLEEWVAFAETNLNGNFQPSLQTVDMMVRKQFVKQEKIHIKQEEPDIKVFNPKISTEIKNILKTYNAENIEIEYNDVKHIKNEICQTSSPSIGKSSHSQTSSAYAKRTDAGAVLLKFGTEISQDETRDKHVQNFSLSVKLLETQASWDEHDVRYMFDTISEEGGALHARMNEIGQVLTKKHNLEDPVNTITLQGSNVITTLGRIRCDGDGQLNSASVCLERHLPNVTGFRASINLQNIDKYSLFPGQIVAMRTTVRSIKSRYMLVPEKIYTDATPALPAEVPNIPGRGPLRIVVACGPFTLSDNLQNQPLDDLIKHVVNNQANVLILIGPFLDARHASVLNGTITESFRGHFESVIDSFMSALKHLHVQVVLVSSCLDVHHFNIYPTPPFDLSEKYANLHLMPDPSVISLNGLIIGLTSVDVLFHLARAEFNYPPKNPNRMERFISHILAQQCFYPLYPSQSVPGARINVDQGLLVKHGKLPVVPHILILPSNFGYFVKNVNGCIVINPERLAKGNVGGTFACIDVHPLSEGAAAKKWMFIVMRMIRKQKIPSIFSLRWNEVNNPCGTMDPAIHKSAELSTYHIQD